MFGKALSWLKGKDDAPSVPRKNPVAELAESVVSRVSGIVSGFFSRPRGESVAQSEKAEVPVDPKTWRNRFYGKIAELKKLDSSRFTQASWSRFWNEIVRIEADFDSGAAADPADWLVSFRDAVGVLVEIGGLSDLLKKAREETELADLTDGFDRLGYYRVYALADAVLSDADASREHIETASMMLRREFSKLELHPRVIRTRELRASFEEFRESIDSMDLRDYAIDGLKSLSVKYRAVIEATKEHSDARAYDDAVSDLFKSVSSLVPLKGLREISAELSDFLETHPHLRKRWNLSRFAELSDLAKELIRDKGVSKRHVDIVVSTLKKSLAELVAIRDSSNGLHSLVTEVSALDSGKFSKGSWKGVENFLDAVSSASEVSEIPRLVKMGRLAVSRLVDLSRLRNALLQADSVLKRNGGQVRNSWNGKEALSRMEIACELLEKDSPSRMKVEFVASVLESYVLSATPRANVDSLATKFRRMVSSVIGDFAH